MLSPLADPTAPRSIALDPTKWLDIVAIALCAVVSGDDIEDFGKSAFPRVAGGRAERLY